MKKTCLLALILVALVFTAACGRVAEVLPDAVTGILDNQTTEDEPLIVDEPFDDGGDDIDEPVSQYDEEHGGLGGVPPIIEIDEDRIIFGGAEISLEELEGLLVEHSDYIWQLYDAHQAVQIVYASVIELFDRHNIAFQEITDED